MSAVAVMGVADDLREQREKLDDITERLTRLEERHTIVSKASHEDRVAMRIRVEDVAKEVAKVAKDQADLKKSADAILDQIKGGLAVVRALWWLGGIIAVGIGHFSGLLHYLLPFWPGPR